MVTLSDFKPYSNIINVISTRVFVEGALELWSYQWLYLLGPTLLKLLTGISALLTLSLEELSPPCFWTRACPKKKHERNKKN